MPGHVGGARVFVVASLVITALAGGGCTSKAGDAHDLAVSSDKQARDVVDEALLDLKAGRVDDVVARFCDRSAAGAALARALLLPGVGRADVTVRRVEPAWVGTEPFFYVEVGTADDTWVHGLGVEVRKGCLERAVGAGEAAGVAEPVLETSTTAPTAPTAGVDAGSLVE